MFYLKGWLNELNLQYKVINPQRDLANGLSVAQIISYYQPNLIGPQNLQIGLATDKCVSNWEFITTKLQQADFSFPANYKQLVAEIVSKKKTNAGEQMLGLLYEFLTGKRLPQIKIVKEDYTQQKLDEENKLRQSMAKSAADMEAEAQAERQRMIEQYNNSFVQPTPSVLEIFSGAYKQTFQAIQKMTMYDIFTTFGELEHGLGDVDEELKQHRPIQVYGDEIPEGNIFKFFEKGVGLQNIESGSGDPLACEIYFHVHFLNYLEQNMSVIIQTCGTSLQSQFPVFLKMLNIYYNSGCDIIFMKQKDITYFFMDQLVEHLEANNNKNSAYLQVLVNMLLQQLPSDFMYIGEQFINVNVLAERQMLTHVVNDQFYKHNIYFLRQRLNSGNIVTYHIKDKATLSQTSFVCSILSKIILSFPKPVLTIINSYILQILKINSALITNTASKEYIDTMTSREQDTEDFNILITEYQKDNKWVNRTQLLFLMLLAEQFTFTFEQTSDVTCNILSVCKYFMYFAIQLDHLRSNNNIVRPLIVGYLDRKKNLSVMYLIILQKIFLILQLDTQKISNDETVEPEFCLKYIYDFVTPNDSKLSLVYKGVNLLTSFVLGVSKREYQQGSQTPLHQIITNFCKSERSDTIQAVLTSASQICEYLYYTIQSLIAIIVKVYQDQMTPSLLQKNLVHLPQGSLSQNGIDQHFQVCQSLIQQLSKVCFEVLEIVERIHETSQGMRKTDSYNLIDMDLDEEPIWSAMTELHKALKRLF